MNWYTIFEESGYINYNINRSEQNNLVIDNSNNNSNNLYSWRKNDIREDWKFRKELFKNVKTTSVDEIKRNMMVLDSGAINGV